MVSCAKRPPTHAPRPLNRLLSLGFFRVFRALRPLRSLNAVPQMKAAAAIRREAMVDSRSVSFWICFQSKRDKICQIGFLQKKSSSSRWLGDDAVFFLFVCLAIFHFWSGHVCSAGLGEYRYKLSPQAGECVSRGPTESLSRSPDADSFFEFVFERGYCFSKFLALFWSPFPEDARYILKICHVKIQKTMLPSMRWYTFTSCDSQAVGAFLFLVFGIIGELRSLSSFCAEKRTARHATRLSSGVTLMSGTFNRLCRVSPKPAAWPSGFGVLVFFLLFFFGGLLLVGFALFFVFLCRLDPMFAEVLLFANGTGLQCWSWPYAVDDRLCGGAYNCRGSQRIKWKWKCDSCSKDQRWSKSIKDQRWSRSIRQNPASFLVSSTFCFIWQGEASGGYCGGLEEVHLPLLLSSNSMDPTCQDMRPELRPDFGSDGMWGT